MRARLCHCEAVARDAGALVLIEAPGRGIGEDDAAGLFLAAELAGLLHDIKRRKRTTRARQHRGGKDPEGPGAGEDYRKYIVDAIRNHEAFKGRQRRMTRGTAGERRALRRGQVPLGPENFTTTLWTIVNDYDMPPESLHKVFKEKMKASRRSRIPSGPERVSSSARRSSTRASPSQRYI